MKHKAENYIGWYGVLAILLAYFLISLDIIGVHSLAYQLMNLTGAIGIIIEALSKKDMQPAVLNAVWAGIAIIVLVQLALGH